jgi:hypothetical protein
MMTRGGGDNWGDNRVVKGAKRAVVMMTMMTMAGMPHHLLRRGPVQAMAGGGGAL